MEESEDKEIICLRAFRIMEIAFLISEIGGRKVKKLAEEEIDSEEFEMYCKENYGKFKETILYYS